jgi:hypothetical protein
VKLQDGRYATVVHKRDKKSVIRLIGATKNISWPTNEWRSLHEIKNVVMNTYSRVLMRHLLEEKLSAAYRREYADNKDVPGYIFVVQTKKGLKICQSKSLNYATKLEKCFKKELGTYTP